MLQEKRGGVGPESERAAIEPGEVARLRGHVPNSRKIVRQQVGEQAPVSIQMLQQPSQPRRALSERCDRRNDAKISRPRM